MKATLLKVTVIVSSYLVAVYTAVYWGEIYGYLFPAASSGGLIGDPDTLNWIRGYSLAVIPLLTTLIHLIGGKHVWRWNIIALLPVLLFEIMFDPLHIYFPLLIGASAWGVGTAVNKLMQQYVPTLLTKIS